MKACACRHSSSTVRRDGLPGRPRRRCSRWRRDEAAVDTIAAVLAALIGHRVRAHGRSGRSRGAATRAASAGGASTGSDHGAGAVLGARSCGLDRVHLLRSPSSSCMARRDRVRSLGGAYLVSAGLGRRASRRARGVRVLARGRPLLPRPLASGRWNPRGRRGRASRRADPEAAARVPVGPRAGRALDRPAHGRRGVRARRRPRTTATTRSCSTSSATCSSRCTSCRCCSRSAGTGRWPRWPTTCTPSSCGGTRTSSATVEVESSGRGAQELGPDQEGRGRARAGDLRRRAREPARAAVRAQDAAPGGLHGLRLRPRALRGRAAASWRSWRRRRRARSASTRSATCCSRRSTSRAS